MTITDKYDRFITGFAGGLLLPFLTGLIIFLFTSHGSQLSTYLFRIKYTGIVTHAITLCVFSNILIFLIFNRFDMLKAARGTLAMTLIWALIVFGVKIFL
jgi:hypothetical protein